MAFDGVEIPLCFNYGCRDQEGVRFGALPLAMTQGLLRAARSPADERERIALAVGRLYRWAGTQIPISADRAGNLLDGEVHGRMDCIDHATSTTRLLTLMQDAGWLRWHRVETPARRTWLILQHYAAVLEETAPAFAPVGGESEHAPGARYVIDSWFVEHGEPAVILPLQEWLRGGGPNVH